jgi:hypothetical protein
VVVGPVAGTAWGRRQWQNGEGIEIDAGGVASDELRANGGEGCRLAGACVVSRVASCIAVGSARVRALALTPS